MKRVLYVENEECLRRAVNRLLSDGDFEVILAENGRVAVELLKTQNFDAVLSDVEMPIMDGVALFEWIQTEKPDLVKKFLFISGGWDVEIGRKLNQTSVKILPKPCATWVLKAAISEAANA